MDTEARSKSIRQRLVVDEGEVFRALLGRLERFLMLDTAGDVHFRFPKDALTQRQAAALYVVGRKFAHMGGLTSNDVVTVGELVDFLAASPKVVSARMSELKGDGLVEGVGRGQWRARYAVIYRILDEIEDAIQGDFK